MRAGYMRALRFPIVATIFAYALITVNVKLFPVMVVSGDVLAGYAFLNVVFTIVGVWAGYKIVQLGGKFLDVVLVSFVIGGIVGLLQIVQGVLVSLPALVNIATELPTVVYSFANTEYGAMIGGAFALTK